MADYRVFFECLERGDLGSAGAANLDAVRVAKMCYTVARQNRKPPKTPEMPVETGENALHEICKGMELTL